MKYLLSCLSTIIIGYVFSVLESMHEKGKGMNEKELKNGSEALEILKTFAR